MNPMLGLLLAVALTQAAPAPEPQNALAGQLLVASQELTDPNFTRTVVLIVEKNEEGTLGVVVNRPLGRVPAAVLLRRLGLGASAAEGEVEMFSGGPVQQEIGLVVHSDDYRTEATMHVADGIDVTASPQALEAIAVGRGPKRALPALGYAGWGPGQLEREMATGSWSVIPADPALIFERPPAQRWEEAQKRTGTEL